MRKRISALESLQTGAVRKFVGHSRYKGHHVLLIFSSSDYVEPDFYFLTPRILESAEKLKMQDEKDAFIFILDIQNIESALPLNEK